MNKKRILIGLIFIIVLVIIVCSLVLFLNKKEDVPADNLSTEAINEEMENKDNNENQEDIIDKENGESEEIEITDNNENAQEEITTPVTSTPKSTPKVTQKQETETKSNNIIPSQTPTLEPTTETITDTTEQGNNTNANENEDTSQGTKSEITHVINYDAIEKIRQTIINNESEYMKTYGYTIVVDSSIKSLTNPFTFTEVRVKSLLKAKFGTIRIYAEDYCVDGQVIMTDSYIL